MAIYRSDQAQFTFAAETTPGAAPERADNSGVGSGSTLSAAAVVGDRTIEVADGAPFNNNTLSCIVIDAEEDTTPTPPGPCEIRRVVNVAGTVLTLDGPLAFQHGSGASVVPTSGTDPSANLRAHTAGSATAQSSAYVTWIPGIYDTVDAPDPVEAMEPRYMLGQNTVRNPYQIVKGQQTFTGSVAGITLINGWPLRFPLGELQTSYTTATPTVQADTTCDAVKGDVWIKLTKGSGAGNAYSAGEYIFLDHSASPVSSKQTGGTKSEIRKIVTALGALNNSTGVVRVNYPLQFDHASGVVAKLPEATIESAAALFTHHIFDTVELPSVTWNINMKDENGTNAFQRRYTGGKIGSMTLTAEEGALVTCDWDTATFMNFSHNQVRSPRAVGTANDYLRRYLPMLDIAKSDVGIPDVADSATITKLPATEPYYFSEGNVKFFGANVARVRTFSLTVANGEEARYYIRENFDDSRNPFEIKEGNREYSMTATVALPDSATPGSTAHNLWKELIMAGDHTTAGTDVGHAGFDIELKFRRGGSDNDLITIRIPGDYDGTATTNSAAGGLKQGALINSAPINIDGSNPMEQAVDIVFRDLKIEIKDNEPMYP